MFFCRPMFRAALAAAIVFGIPALRAATPQHGPDLTAGDSIPEKSSHDWNLGATGARGWMHSDRLVTSSARQIAITAVAADSPADGVLKVGDVILGIGRQQFASDPRTEFGRALTDAESTRGRGRLRLLRWRDGRTGTVTLRLPVLGSYSATAPYDCEKSERILERGCAVLAERMQAADYRPNPIPRCLNALALLASGEETYLPLVRREARWGAEFTADSFQTWYYGYVSILLAEYTLATGDDSCVPGLRRLALEAARGQSAVGSWGHRFADDDGRLLGYGMMNAPGVPLTIGLVMARRAGVEDPEVARAIQRSVDLLRFYVGKGAIPYGDHHPWIQTHEDNGKCGMGAVLFDLLGDQEAARYFTRMSVASHGPERDCGHTGNFFNLLWALPAISRAGPAATGVWMEEFGGWYADLARQWDGSFRHLGPPEERPDKYASWDATGAWLLAFALPRRVLMLTGREPATVEAATAEQAKSLIADGRGWDNRDRGSFYARLSERELLARLQSWSPVVRERAATALRQAKGDVVPELVRRLTAPQLQTQLGACQALAWLGGRAAPAVEPLRACLAADELWLRVKAAGALGAIGKPAIAAVPDLLRALTREPSQADPRGMEQRYLCFTLFDRRRGMLQRSLDGVDRDELLAAVREGLRNQDGRARSAVGSFYETLPPEWLEPLLPAIHEAVLEPSPSGIMFADGVRMAGLKILAQQRLAEGIEACAFYVRHMKPHGSEKRVPEVLAILEGYGAHAQAVIPDLERTASYFAEDEPDFPEHLSQRKAEAVRGAIARIREATARPELGSIR